MRSSLIIFKYLDDGDIAWIQRSCLVVRHAKGDVLIEAGVLNQAVFLLLEGRCTASTAAGRFLDTLTPGDIMGEVSFVDGRRSTARVLADSEVLVAVLDRDLLEGRFDEDPAFAARFFRATSSVLAYRLRSNLQATHGGGADVMDGAQEFSGEIDGIDLDGVARAGARLAEILGSLAQR